MQRKGLYMLDKVAELEEMLDSAKEIRLYGAGHYLNMFLQEIEKLDKQYLEKIKCIMVSDASVNPAVISNIPVVGYREADLKQGDLVFLTLGKRFVDEVYNALVQYTGEGNIIQMDFNMFHEKAYRDVKESIQPVIDNFPQQLLCPNEPVYGNEITAWTCWWQGEEQAPEIVKACMESQRRNLPEGVKHVVITAQNYEKYITIPKYIIKKVESGDIGLAHLADIIRVNLLYIYGGFWMDAEVFILERLPESILDCPFYTRALPEAAYYTDVVWGTGFLYAKPGSKLFRFLTEGFAYYFSVHDRLKYYFTIDYMISVACNTFPDVKQILAEVPYNNDKAFELARHLMEPFDEERYKVYTKETSIQFLTHKLGTFQKEQTKNTIYEYILKKYQ